MLKPVGSGMPMKKAGGAIIRMVSKIFSQSGQPTPASVTGETHTMSSVTATATRTMVALRRAWLSPTMRRLK